MGSRALLRRAAWIALAVAVALCVAGVFQHGLWTPDEPREAEVGREMLDTHFSAMPTLGGQPFLEKPPLYAWITAASYSVFGVSAGAARVPSTLFAIGSVVVAYLLGRRAAGRAAGLCSAIVLATMWQFAETSHKAVLDVALTFFVAAGHLAFDAARRRGATPYVVIGLTSGLAFLTKAWVGPALLCAPPIVAAAALRDWEYVKRVLPRAFVASVLGVAAFGLPWVMALAATPGGGWAAVKECLVNEYIGRSVGGAAYAKQGHANPPWYYTYTALVVIAPWCLAIPAMAKSRALSATWRGGRALWLALVFLAGVVLLSLPNGKRDLYLVPLLPAGAAAVGAWLSRAGTRSSGPWDVATCRAFAGVAWLLCVAVGVGSILVARGVVPVVASPGVQEMLAGRLRDFAIGAAAVGIPALLAAIWVRRVKRIELSPGGRAAWALVVLFALLHAAVGPMLDPLRDLSDGARRVAALVPAGEPLLGLSSDETTLAVVPFYTGRILGNVEEPADAVKALDSGAARHLVVMDKSLHKMTPALKKRLDLVETVRMSATREVSVYAFKP